MGDVLIVFVSDLKGKWQYTDITLQVVQRGRELRRGAAGCSAPAPKRISSQIGFWSQRLRVSSGSELENEYNDKLIEEDEQEEGIDSDVVVAKCAEIQKAISEEFTIFDFGSDKVVKNWHLFFCVSIGLWAGLRT
ncbi:hypothetical protein K7X08_036442 [Anisodus acutangulus]|uniref:Uncharacterized protein n=1 Tax=Anisodus acutangulus TaxID=402998 RepID=A0A9Q1L612_9SOLA|nr:hypothetical protein K7X08_036442 [Anisodus acutangulus]